jgi:hypothetical protein
MTISPELLCSYADGELDAETAHMVEAQIAGDPQLQADLAAHRALRARLTAHFAPIAEQPVPDRLRQALMGDGDEPKVIDFAAEVRKRRTPIGAMRWQRIAGPAIAASLVLGVIGYGLRSPNDNLARGDLAEALDGQLVATQAADAPVHILLTVRDEQGRYCRGFTGQAGSGLACRDGRDWRLVKTFGGANSASTEYRQAGSEDSAVMAAMQDMAAGAALDATEEAQAARQGWQASHAP